VTKRLIYVTGCDDSTSVVLDLDDAEYALAQRIAKQVTEAGGGCMPVMDTASDGEEHWGWEYAQYSG
jgi:hypothetical protein